MLDETVMPFLRSLDGEDSSVVVSRVLHTWGMSEAAVGELLDDLFHSSQNPTVAFLASAGVIKIRLTAHAPTTGDACALIEPLEAAVRLRLGDRVFGVDEQTIRSTKHKALTRLREHLSSEEQKGTDQKGTDPFTGCR